ncbi:hypothetical protein ABK040_003256 [Willaertia magna]
MSATQGKASSSSTSSSTTTNVSKPSVTEIQKVYQLVEENKYANALKECDNLLEKYPNDNFFLSFKALSLISLQKRKEAIQIIDDIIENKKVEVNEFILNTLALALTKIFDWKRIADLYEKVYSQLPTNTQQLIKYKDIMEKYFFYLVKSDQLEKQQTVAVKLWRTFNDNENYMYWNICSMLLLRKEKPMLFTLASKMLEKEFDLNINRKDLNNKNENNKINYNERLRVFIENVLAVNEEYEKIVKLLENDEPWAKELEPMPYDRKAILASYCLKLENYYLLGNGLYVYLLEKEDADEWPWWKGFILSIILINRKKDNLELKKTLQWNDKVLNCYTSIEDAHKFIKSLQLKDKRGPYLAEFEFLKSLKEEGITQGDLFNENILKDLIINYFKLFGTKKICYDDLKVYIDLLKEKEVLLKELKESMQNFISNEKDIDKVEYEITFHKIQRHCQSIIGYKNVDELIIELIKKYMEALPLGKDLKETDYQYGDEFLLIACHYLIDKEEFIYSAILLEYALKKSKFNFHFKVLLIRVYVALNSFGNRTFNLFMNDLDVKHIQFESISYLIYHDLIRVGVCDKAMKIADKILHFFNYEHLFHTSDYLTLPYKQQSWSKIEEMTTFRHKLDYSYQIAKCQIDKIYLDLVFNDVQSSREMIEKLSMLDLEEYIYNKVMNNKNKNKTISFSHNEDLSILKYFGDINLKEKYLIPKELLNRPSLTSNYMKIKIIELYVDLLANNEILSEKPPKQPSSNVATNKKKKNDQKDMLLYQQKLKEYERKVANAKRVISKLKEKTLTVIEEMKGSDNALPSYCMPLVEFFLSVVDNKQSEEKLEQFVKEVEKINALKDKEDYEKLTNFIVWEISFIHLIAILLKEAIPKTDKNLMNCLQQLKSQLFKKSNEIENYMKEFKKQTKPYSLTTTPYFSIYSNEFEGISKDVLFELNDNQNKNGILNSKLEQIIANISFHNNK